MVSIALAMPRNATAHTVAVGGQQACAITSVGTVKCWGANEWGQLGNGNQPPADNRNTSADSSTPVDVVGISSGATAVAAGRTHTCAIVGGAAKCWGENTWNQLGDGTSTPSPVPLQVLGLNSGVTAIAASYFNTCAVQYGTVKCWGTNNYGNLFNGYPNVVGTSTPVLVPGLDGATDVAVAAWHACAIVSGAAKCFGEQGAWEYPLGAGTDSKQNQLNQVTGLDGGVTSIAAVCAVQNSAAKCWASYLWGPAVGSQPTGIVLATVVPGMDANTSMVTGGSGGSGASVLCAIVNQGAVCAGDNSDGRLGNGDSVAFHSDPVQVFGLGSGVTDISAGQDATCARANGAIKCWGSNNRGQLGDGTTSSSPVPVDVDLGAGQPDSSIPITPDGPPPPTTATRCEKITLIGLRGVTEKQSSKNGFGETVNEFRKSFRAELSSGLRRITSDVGLKYDAKPSSFGNWIAEPPTGWWSTYKSSMKTGRKALRKLLNSASHGECFVIAGYSQGAHVLGDVLTDRRLLSADARGRILVAVLIADTRFNPNDSTIQRYGSYDPTKHGRMSPRTPGSMNSVNVPYIPYVVMTACKKYDYFCQYLGTPDLKKAFDTHGSYKKTAKNLGSIAGDYVDQELSPGLTPL